jgi:hypothetical protein
VTAQGPSPAEPQPGVSIKKPPHIPAGFQNSILGSDQRVSRRGVVLVDQSAEDGSAPDPAVDRLGDKRFRTRRAQLQRSMRPPRVVVHGIPGKHPTKVLLAEDQHAVGEFGADGQYEAFGEAVRPRTARRDFDNLDAGIGQHGVERGRELPGTVANQEPKPANLLAEVHDEVASLLRGPGPVGVRGDAQDVQVAVVDFEGEQDVEPS